LKPFPIAKKWAMRVTDEFFLQGDKERAQKMPTTPMCDRNTQVGVFSLFSFLFLRGSVCVIATRRTEACAT